MIREVASELRPYQCFILPAPSAQDAVSSLTGTEYVCHDFEIVSSRI